MKIALTPRQLREVLAEAKETDLKAEIATREDRQHHKRCDFCDKPLNSEPYCSIPYRHEGREPEDWEGICDTPRISKDRRHLSYWRDNMHHVTMSRFPGLGWHHDIRVHLPCDGDGCDDQFCDNGFVRKHIDFGDDLKVKWPAHVKDFGPGGPSKHSGPWLEKKKHA